MASTSPHSFSLPPPFSLKIRKEGLANLEQNQIINIWTFLFSVYDYFYGQLFFAEINVDCERTFEYWKLLMTIWR